MLTIRLSRIGKKKKPFYRVVVIERTRPRDGQYDRQYGGSRTDHQQPNDANDVRAYRDGYKHGYRNIAVRYN